jgi:carbon-monoxide dehydrogenase large subunit
VAPYLECTGGAPREEARVAFAADGTLTLSVGSHSTGMGHETALPQILAAKLGLPISAVRFQQADTAVTRMGGGHGGSRGLEVGGNAVAKAADEMIAKGRIIAAHLLNSRPEDIAHANGRFSDIKTGQSLAIGKVVAAAADASRLPPGMRAGALDTDTVYEREAITIPNGCHAAEVEVDPDTGVVAVVGFWAVDDFGRIINPMLADGQVMGGIAQGLGQALLEEVVYASDSGQPLTGSFMDYALPRADQVPPLVVEYDESAPTLRNPLGVKGAGEAGCCGAPPAIVNAVLDALAEYGVTHLDMPLTPQKVWRAITDSRVAGQLGEAG